MAHGIIEDITIKDGNINISFIKFPSVQLPQPITLAITGDNYILDYTVNSLKTNINKSNKAKATELIDTIVAKEQQNIKKSPFFDKKLNISKK